ncbi:rod-determining factor RdfA [Haloarcula amylovorans]|uniref:rod-determining factor RdfA n=1 Tax=Haloarcula amylovorans TaxID=2562280 RepID=UPI0010766FFC|nr:rod-determining factor RdfA [Halomicroarcula amylolytica]
MSAESGTTCKVDRVAKKRGLTELDDELRKRWADGDSLRDLERYCNESILRSAMHAAGMNTLDGEAANLYRLFTDDDVGPSKRIDAKFRLQRNGLDPETLAGDFVSYQTVRTHLNDCLDVTTARDSTLSVDSARTTVLKLVSRTESVTNQTITRLAGQGSLTIPSPSVTLSLRVACSECGDEYTFTGLLERGGCSCQNDADGVDP